MDLILPQSAAFSAPEKIDFLTAALGATPDMPWLRIQLASLLVLRDKFSEAIDLLHGRNFAGAWQHRARMLEGNAWLSVETAQANRQASDMFDAAQAAAQLPQTRSQALAALGKAQLRLGHAAEARAAFERALALDASNPDAQKRLSALDMNQGREAQVLQRCDALLAAGVHNARLLADRYLALALLGRTDEAHHTEGLDQFLVDTIPAAPNGWATLEQFNAALREELRSHPSLRFERYGTASSASWRIDEPLLARSTVFPAMLEMVRREVGAHLDRLDDAHVLKRSRPARAQIRAWAVLAQGPGHEEWHMHQSGWISGVYYAAVPASVASARDQRGCIEFGNPELPHIARPIPGQRRTVRPGVGKLLLFPSQAYHHTYPSDSQDQRMAIAFDVVPAEH
ncbi:MAG: putative 2OG-Fe(II) oxygenase [Pseudomonadota bacterium]